MAMATMKGLAKAVIEKVPVLNRMLLASAGYRVLSREEAAVQQRAAGWHSRRSARRQEHSYRKLLANLRAGRPRLDLAVAAKAVEAVGLTGPSILEVGCGNGYYSEVFSRLLHGGIEYTGLDYSPNMVESAQRCYPDQRFVIGDATDLQFDDGAFDIVFNGVALMHILEYRSAIIEAARVSRFHVIFHGVPVVATGETAYLFKYAYGEPVIEIVFAEQELSEVFSSVGLEVVQTWELLSYDLVHVLGRSSRLKTYLCSKRRAGIPS